MIKCKFKRRYILYWGLVFILLCLIIAPKYTFEAAKEGLLLWSNVIIPSLLPFIIVSNLLIHFNLVHYISFIFKPIMKYFFNLPAAAGYAWVLGMLSGYPMGAKITADLLREKYITQKQAQYLLTFCNNASPMFVLGFVSVGILDVGHIGFYLLLILYLSSFITGVIFRFVYQIERPTLKNKKIYTLTKTQEPAFKVFDQCIMDGIDLIVRIGGYVIFFSIVLSLVSFIPIESLLIKNFLLGTVEISNGISLISKTSALLNIKIILVNTIIAFGGFSIHAQTASVLQNTNLSIVKYVFAKGINAFITFILTLLFFILTGF
jgi:sporulation integral membrane protein YlbJ